MSTVEGKLGYPSLCAAFEAAANALPDFEIARDEGAVWTYRDLRHRARMAAKALINDGLLKGERVAIWADNHMEWVVAGLAVHAAGGVIVPIGTRLRGREVADIMRRSNARMLLTDPGFGSTDFVAAIEGEDVPALKRIVVFAPCATSGRVMAWEAFQALGRTIAEEELDRRIASVGADDLSDILFTSGTTGQPKGVPMTHGQSLVACELFQKYGGRFHDSDRYAVTFPFAHNAGYRAGWLASVLLRVCFVPVRNLSPTSLLKLATTERLTVMPAVPTVLLAMLDHPERAQYDLGNVRRIMTGATSIPIALITRLQAEFGKDAIATAYGLTECAGLVSHTRPEDEAETIVTTVGRVFEELDVRLIDDFGNVVPAGENGEIIVRGATVMTAYLDDPEATATAFTPDGYFRTGDIGSLDAAGNLKITDRLKDMYIVGGFNAYPAEIEHYLRQLDGVRDAAVVGVPDERLGQVGHAFVIRDADVALDETGGITWCREGLANDKAPREVTFVGSSGGG